MIITEKDIGKIAIINLDDVKIIRAAISRINRYGFVHLTFAKRRHFYAMADGTIKGTNARVIEVLRD